jgi:hypothetical protein
MVDNSWHLKAEKDNDINGGIGKKQRIKKAPNIGSFSKVK